MEVYRRERNCVEDDGPFRVVVVADAIVSPRKRHPGGGNRRTNQSFPIEREASREVYFPNVATIENQIRTQSNYTLFLIWFRSQTNLWQAKQKQKQYNKQQ